MEGIRLAQKKKKENWQAVVNTAMKYTSVFHKFWGRSGLAEEQRDTCWELPSSRDNWLQNSKEGQCPTCECKFVFKNFYTIHQL